MKREEIWWISLEYLMSELVYQCCWSAGSVDERRYLKHEILNNYVQFNVIVTT